MRSHSPFDDNKKRSTATTRWSVVQRVLWTAATLLLLSSSSSSRSVVVVNAQEASANSTTTGVVAGSGPAVRYLFNLGVSTDEPGCNDEQFDLIKSTIGRAAQQSLTFKALKQDKDKDNKKKDKNNKKDDRWLQSRLPINCARVCCGYALGTCGFYSATASCANFPTVASNRECPRRLRSADDDTDDFADRHGKAQIQADPKLTKACRALEKEATIAITSILDLLDDNCADLALLPTLLECFLLDDQ